MYGNLHMTERFIAGLQHYEIYFSVDHDKNKRFLVCCTCSSRGFSSFSIRSISFSSLSQSWGFVHDEGYRGTSGISSGPAILGARLTAATPVFWSREDHLKASVLANRISIFDANTLCDDLSGQMLWNRFRSRLYPPEGKATEADNASEVKFTLTSSGFWFFKSISTITWDSVWYQSCRACEFTTVTNPHSALFGNQEMFDNTTNNITHILRLMKSWIYE